MDRVVDFAPGGVCARITCSFHHFPVVTEVRLLVYFSKSANRLLNFASEWCNLHGLGCQSVGPTQRTGAVSSQSTSYLGSASACSTLQMSPRR